MLYQLSYTPKVEARGSGGVALVRAGKALEKLKLEGDQRVGLEIIRRAIEEPMRWIVLAHAELVLKPACRKRPLRGRRYTCPPPDIQPANPQHVANQGYRKEQGRNDVVGRCGKEVAS